MKVLALVTASLALVAGPAIADDVDDEPRFTSVPAACLPFWIIPGGKASPVAWSQSLSYAACIQDASVERVTRIDELEGLVARFQEALTPALEIYVTAIQHGPGPVKLRAAFQIGMAELALMTRARASIVTPPDFATNRLAASHHRRMHDALEPHLREQAKLAWLVFTVVDRASADNAALTPDATTRFMASAARELARQLHASWGFQPDESEQQHDDRAPRSAPH